MNDKIIKALEGLKFLNLSSIVDTTTLKKEKVAACVSLADQITSLKPGVHSSSELTSRAVEGLINLCDDADSDVRAAADESLHRVLRVLSEWNVLSVQRELYGVIKKNGNQRCVRTALTKFAALVERTNPCKGRAFAVNLIPCLVNLVARPEEAVIETLGNTLERIWGVLGKFANFSQTKEILKAFLANLSSENAVIRRTSASSLAIIVSHSCKPDVFVTFVLNCLFDKVVPVNENSSTYLLQGVFNALKGLLPVFVNHDDSSVDTYLKIYELCLHYCVNRDHNLVIAALETLNQLLSHPSRRLKLALLNPSGITQSFIHITQQSSKLWSRSASEISVAGSITTGDESLLDDGDVLFQSLVIPEQTSYTINRLRTLSAEDDADSDPESVTSELSPSILFVKNESKKEEEENFFTDEFVSLPASEFDKDIDVGSFTDSVIPLLFCARRLAACLLNGTAGNLRSDRFSRVAVKSMAVSCLSNVVQLCPQVLSIKLTPFSDCDQKISDILLLTQHTDPQLRGVVSILIGSFLNTCLIEDRGRGIPSLDDASNPLSIQNLVDLLSKCLCDPSFATSRLALSGFQICQKRLILSDYHSSGIKLISFLVGIDQNAYWLNKVRLMETLSDVDFVVIAGITGNREIEKKVLRVFMAMVRDVDGRVRRAAAEAILNVIPKLCVNDSPYVSYCQRFSEKITEDLRERKKETSIKRLELSFPYKHLKNHRKEKIIEAPLSNIVAELTNSLVVYTDKYHLYGIVETLRLVSDKYPPVIYTNSWQCNRLSNTGISCLLQFLVSLISSNADVIDLSCLENITRLISNLYAGYAISAMRPVRYQPDTKWQVFDTDEMGNISNDFLTHLLTVLNILTQLQEAVGNVKPHGRILHLLPAKKGEREEVSYRVQPHYQKLHQILRFGDANYKMCIDDSTNEKYLGVLSATLYGLSTVLEMCLPYDSSRIVEELLSYMRVLMPIRPTAAITVVLQLFRSLFTINIPSRNIGGKQKTSEPINSTMFSKNERRRQCPDFEGGIYNLIYYGPQKFMESVKIAPGLDDEKDPTGFVSYQGKTELVSHLKLLEHMIIKALQMYTITPDTDFQCVVLTLLTEMVKQNVKYSHLDEQLVFIGFVKKQLGLIERGYVIKAEEILPKIFTFFVSLSNERQNTKALMSIPDILQLCLDLMASEQPEETHCIPGLMPVVVGVFTQKIPWGEDREKARKEADSQRQVVTANLLRFTKYPGVWDAFYYVKDDSSTGRSILLALLPLLENGDIELEYAANRKLLSFLFCRLPDSAFACGNFTKMLFSEPRDQGEIYEMVRWLAGQTIFCEALSRLREELFWNYPGTDTVDLFSFLAPSSAKPDPLFASTPFRPCPAGEKLARFIFLIISRSAVFLLNNPGESDELEWTLSEYFVAALALLELDNFKETIKALQNLINTEHDTIPAVTDVFVQLSTTRPLLTSQYFYLLSKLSWVDTRLWKNALTSNLSFSSKLVQRNGILALSDYLTDNTSELALLEFLLTDINPVLELFDEAPVKEVFIISAGIPQSVPIILKAFNKTQLKTAKLTESVLRVLKIIPSDYSGNVIQLLVGKFLRLPYLSLCRVATAQACRRLEYLIFQSRDQVLAQLPHDAFRDIRTAVDETPSKHIALTTLVQKMGKMFYNMQEDGEKTIKYEISQVDEEWFYNQIKQRCCQQSSTYREIGPLLIKLRYPLLRKLFALPDFQLTVLGDCLMAVDVFVTENHAKMEDIPAYTAAREAIIEKIGHVFCEEKDRIWNMARILSIFLDTAENLTDGELTAVVDFSMHCFHIISEGKNPLPEPGVVEAALSCTRALLDHRHAQFYLNRSENKLTLKTALNDCVSIIRTFVPDLQHSENSVKFLVQFLMKPSSLPVYLDQVLKRIAVLLCRFFWDIAVDVPDTRDLDADVVNLFTERIKLLGWTSRSQFEEIWATFLGGFSQEFRDASTISVTEIAALDGISVLMEETLLSKCGDPGSELISHSRDFSILRECANGAPRLNPNDGFYNDLESILQPKGVGLFSVEHLWSATQLAAASPDSVASDSTTRQQIANIGLDLTSCLLFLLEVFSQWTDEVPDQHFLATVLKTSLVLSDQFTDPAQFRSLMNIAMNIDKKFVPNDLPLLPYCILVTAKCQAALLPGGDCYEKLKQIMIRSDSPSAKLATIQSLLILAQSPVVYWKLQPTRQLGNSMFYVEDNEAVTQLVHTFIPYAVELLLEFIADRCSWSETYEIHAWSLLVYLQLHYRLEIQDYWETFIQKLISALSAHCGSHATQIVLLHGIERLFLADVLDEAHINQLEATAQLLIGQPASSARRNGYQLLLTASFISKRRMNPIALDPDNLMAAMECLGLLLGRLRRAASDEAAHAALVLKYLLRDLQPLDVLTKLIQEFLSPHHPYPNILASLLFQVMEDADLPLLQDWVVFSLPSLVHNVPILTSSRTLTCLFLSACRDPWLRAAFPLTQTRQPANEAQFPQLLIVAAAHFYSQLKVAEQRDEFRNVFEAASQTSPVFGQILNAFTSK